MLKCARSEVCVNKDIKCGFCFSMSDIYNQYPFYASKESVEVVRCGKCKYRKFTKRSTMMWGYNCGCNYSPCRGRVVCPTDFCPYGEVENE